MRNRVHGLTLAPGGARFSVWAPRTPRAALRLAGVDRKLLPRGRGWYEDSFRGLGDGAEYAVVLDDGRVRPDPASRRQPQGVHGPSAVFDPGGHAWTDGQWRGLPLEALVFYELHVGTFTPGGTLDTAAERLPDLVDLGVTCVEVMPVQPFAGDRNWGY